MSVVWKYALRIDDEQTVVMPEGAEILHVAEQRRGELCLWVRVIPTGQREVERTILIRGTGRPIWTQPHIGSVLSTDGLVWHVFDGGEDGAT